jgi:uncharacterized membrane protein YccC
MPADNLQEAAGMAAVAGGMGGVARVLVALQGGSRGWQLALDFALGGILGVIAAGAAVYVDPSLQDLGWPMLIIASAAGCAGAIGTRILDIVVAAVQRRLGV